MGTFTPPLILGLERLFSEKGAGRKYKAKRIVPMGVNTKHLPQTQSSGSSALLRMFTDKALIVECVLFGEDIRLLKKVGTA